MGFPINPPSAALVEDDGRTVTREWYKFFRDIQKLIGGPSNPFDDSALLVAMPDQPGDQAGGHQLNPPTIPPAETSEALPSRGPVFEIADDRLEPYGAQRDAALFHNTAGAALTKTNDTNVTLALGGTPATALLQAASLTLGWTGELAVARGGTGRATSTTAYGLIAAGTTATGAHQTLAAGATTEILVGGGASALPVWTTATGTGAPVRASSPTLVTPTLGVASATSINFGGGALSEYVPPTSPAFSAGDYTASGAMTFSVAAGDVTTYAYSIIGKTMTVWFYIQTASVGGTLDRYLYIAIPASKTALNTAYNVYQYYEGAGWLRGFVSVEASGTVIRCEREDNSNWTATANATYLLGQITFPIS